MAENTIKITAEDIKNATTYTELGIKEVLARNIASLLMEPVEINVDGNSALPPMYRENRKLRQQYQMGILATMLHREYTLEKVKIKTDDGTEERQLAWCMSADDYNVWASSHVMNQLERLKKGKDGVDVNKIFDLLYDYKALEMMLSGAIRDELEERNDLFNRAMQYFSVAALQSAMDKMMDRELPKVISELKARESEANG